MLNVYILIIVVVVVVWWNLYNIWYFGKEYLSTHLYFSKEYPKDMLFNGEMRKNNYPDTPPELYKLISVKIEEFLDYDLKIRQSLVFLSARTHSILLWPFVFLCNDTITYLVNSILIDRWEIWDQFYVYRIITTIPLNA